MTEPLLTGQNSDWSCFAAPIEYKVLTAKHLLKVSIGHLVEGTLLFLVFISGQDYYYLTTCETHIREDLSLPFCIEINPYGKFLYHRNYEAFPIRYVELVHQINSDLGHCMYNQQREKYKSLFTNEINQVDWMREDYAQETYIFDRFGSLLTAQR